MADPMKYTEADIKRMQSQVAALQGRLSGEKDSAKREAIQNEINGLQNSISGRYN